MFPLSMSLMKAALFINYFLLSILFMQENPKRLHLFWMFFAIIFIFPHFPALPP